MLLLNYHVYKFFPHKHKYTSHLAHKTKALYTDGYVSKQPV